MARVTLPALTIATVWGVAGTKPAAAHAVFQGVRSVPADADSRLAMFVPHERDEATYNVEIVIAVASGWRAVGCASKPTWTCSLGTSNSSASITYTKEAGATRAEDETFEFTLHSPGPSVTSAFPTRQVYSDAEAVDWTGPPGSSQPAPLLRTLGTDSTAAPSAAPMDPPAAPRSTTTAEPRASAVAIDTASADVEASGSALPVIGVAVVVALGAGVAAIGVLRHRRAP